MAGIERINSLYDTASITKENTELVNQLKSILSIMKEVQGGINKIGSVKGGASLSAETDKLTKSQILLQKQLQETEKTKQQTLRTDKLAEQQSERSSRATEKKIKVSQNEKKVIDQAINEYFQLGKALQEAEIRYKNLAITQGFSNDQTKAALKEALAIRGVLDKVDGNLKNYQRNVGNYGSAFNGLGNSMQQIFREAPAAAVSLNTFFLAISNNLPIFFDELTKAKKVIAETNKLVIEQATAAKIAAEAQSLQSGATKQAAIQQGLLAEKTALANLQQTKAPSLLKQIGNNLFSLNTFLTVGVLLLTLFGGKLVKWISGLFEGEKALKNLNSAHKEYIDVVRKSSESAQKEITTLRVLEKAATDVSKPMKVRLDAVKDLKEQYPKYLENIKNEAILNGEAAVQINAVADALIKKAFYEAASDKATEKASKNIDLKLRENFLENERIKTESNLLRLREKYNKLTIDQSVNAALNTNDNLRLLENETEHLNEINKLLNKNRADQKFNSDQIGYFTKLAADNFETVKKLEIDPIKSTKRIKKTVDEYAKLLEMLEKIYSKSKAIALENKDLGPGGSDQAALDAQRALIIKNTSASVQQIADSNDALYVQDLENLKKRLDTKKITYEQYNSELENLQKGHARTELNNAIALSEALISNLKSRGFDVAEFERQLNEQKQKLYDIDAKAADEAEKKKVKSAEEAAKRKKELHDKEIELAKEVAGLLVQLAVSSIEQQKNALADLQAQKEDNYSRELENIRNSTLSDEEKANRTTVLQAQQAANAKKYAEQQRQLDIKKARFDRLNSIAGVIQNTAKGVVAALADLNPALAVVIGLIGAVQLAKIIATPIPKYAKGTDSAKRGFAWVGEQGVERMEDRAGKVSYTPNKPTLTWLEGGEKITPNHKLTETLPGIAMRKPLYVASRSNGMDEFSSSMTDAISLQTYQLKKAMNKKTKFVTNIRVDANWGNYLAKKVYNTK